MKNYLFFLRSNQEDPAPFVDWLLTEMGTAFAASPDCSGLRINVAVPQPGQGPLYKVEAREGDRYDATIDLQCPDAAAFERLMQVWLPQIDVRTDANHGYEVDLSVEKDDASKLVGNPAPGYKIQRGFYYWHDLSPEAARRIWDNHVNLALKVHGFDRYVRYFVTRVVTPGAPAIDGSTNLQFGSTEDVVERYFRVPNGMDMITHDVATFIEKGLARVFGQEHILK